MWLLCLEISCFFINVKTCSIYNWQKFLAVLFLMTNFIATSALLWCTKLNSSKQLRYLTFSSFLTHYEDAHHERRPRPDSLMLPCNTKQIKEYRLLKWLRYCSCYSNSLVAGCSKHQILGEIFCTHPDQPSPIQSVPDHSWRQSRWGVAFTTHPPPSSAEVREKVKIHLYSPCVFMACSMVNFTITLTFYLCTH
jgi:hypothetical protein